MGVLTDSHKNLTNGVGKCSVPMWRCGMPAGFCDEPAYSTRPESREYMNYCAREYQRDDNRYNGYVPALACPVHGGERKEKVLNLCDYCTKCIADCDGDPVFGHGKGNDNVYGCNRVEYKNQI
ncbi:hypothetical protein EZS27_021532 [termite gut metagenome]|uniref:Uncharacterized protein n=1 Tax=termite gut metagenome TaxID=433724 RepID=A0A5J4R8R7_9ZZZZ